jgi:hypothetical protein
MAGWRQAIELAIGEDDLASLRTIACGFRFNPAGCTDMKPAGIPI